MNHKRRIKVALAGNPNVGKSVIFNNLTGSHQHVGNWPGKTIDKKEGFLSFNGHEIYIVDLPGTYSLTAYSPEEIIARDYIINERPDVVVGVIDASNVERNLYLIIQLLELGTNLVVVLNKMDLAKKDKLKIDYKRLEKELGVPVIPTVAPKKIGMDELCRAIIKAAYKRETNKVLKYSPDVEKFINELVKFIEKDPKTSEKIDPRWLSIKLLENDSDAIEKVKKIKNGEEIIKKARELRKIINNTLGDPEVVLTDERYRLIREVISKVVSGIKTVTASDLLDQVLVDKYFGIPIFAIILWGMFQFGFYVSAPFSDLLADFFAYLSNSLSKLTGISYIDYLFFGDYGILNGLGTILSFVPLIMALYFVLSLLEDSGYMARVAFIMDKAMRKVGLSGRAIIPMILGFGCNVPAIYATRVIPDKNDRLVAMLVNPLVLCSARLTVFSAIAGAFFGVAGGDIIFSLYLLGIILAFAIAIILRKTVLKGRASPFIVEFPQYQRPVLKVAFIHAWQRASLFFKKAGTIILIGLLVIGVLAITDAKTFAFTKNIDNSLVALLGKMLQPLFMPLNWDWRLVVAAIFGFVAKEIVLGATAMLYGAPEEEIGTKLTSLYSPLLMYAYMVFILIYVPCIATLGAIKHETGSWKWTLFTITYEVLLAYVMAWSVLIIGNLIGVK